MTRQTSKHASTRFGQLLSPFYTLLPLFTITLTNNYKILTIRYSNVFHVHTNIHVPIEQNTY